MGFVWMALVGFVAGLLGQVLGFYRAGFGGSGSNGSA